MYPHHTTNEIPYGYCHCGCGEKTSISKGTGPGTGVKGEPRIFKRGHYRRGHLSYTVDPETGCWVWDGHCNASGYGQFRLGSAKMKLAHRYYYELLVGPISEGHDLHHICENPKCVNPAHLEPLSRKVHRRKSKFTKLTKADVDEIRHLRGQVSQTELDHRYGVAQATIGKILLGKIWTD